MCDMCVHVYKITYIPQYIWKIIIFKNLHDQNLRDQVWSDLGSSFSTLYNNKK
jgi:hypothetical protein